ncbi:MAG: hypothetical protein WKG00_14555, partial [Polyangiaceae bacterium]
MSASSPPPGDRVPRRSRRTLKIPDDAVPTHGSQPPGAARSVSSAPPRLASDPPPRAPATTTPWDSGRASPASAPADDIIRPMRIISIGDPTPMPARADAFGWHAPSPARVSTSSSPGAGDGAPSHPGPAAGLAALALSLGMPAGEARGRAQLRDTPARERPSGQPGRPSDAPSARDAPAREARHAPLLDELTDRTLVDLADADDGFADAITAERDVFVPPEARVAFEQASRGELEPGLRAEQQLDSGGSATDSGPHARADMPPVAMPAGRESDDSFEEIEPEADSTPSTDLALAASASASSATPSSATPSSATPSSA